MQSPFNSWLALRGIRTMPVRLAHQSQAIQTVLSALQKDSRISRLYHPFVGNQQQQALAEKYLTGYGNIIGLTLLGGEPMEPVNQRALLPLLCRFRERFPKKNIWCYTGYTLYNHLLTDKVNFIDHLI